MAPHHEGAASQALKPPDSETLSTQAESPQTLKSPQSTRAKNTQMPKLSSHPRQHWHPEATVSDNHEGAEAEEGSRPGAESEFIATGVDRAPAHLGIYHEGRSASRIPSPCTPKVKFKVDHFEAEHKLQKVVARGSEDGCAEEGASAPKSSFTQPRRR